MQDGYNQNEMPLNNTNTPSNGPTIVKTDVGSKDGQNKCPKCGSTEIMTNVKTGKLRCLYCRTEFEPEKVAGLDGDVSELVGEVIGSGATDIVAYTNEVLTFKCSSCVHYNFRSTTTTFKR